MLIKQRLRVTTITVAMSAIVAFALILATGHRVVRAIEQNRIADALMSAQLERLAHRTDYIRTGNERAQEQVIAKFRQIDELLKAAFGEFTESEDKKKIVSLMEGQKSIGIIFRNIVANRRDADARGLTASIAQEKEDRLLAQLDMRVYEAVLLGQKLQESGNTALLSSFKMAGGGISIVLVLMSVVLLGNVWTLERTINRRMERLHEGTTIIGNGNLDHTIDASGNDEFSQLSQSFNEMTVKLRQSHRILEDEIRERKFVEESLRLSREDLRRAQEVAHIGNWRLSVKNNALLWSDEIYRIFGIPLETPLSYDTFLGAIHPDDRAYVNKMWQAALQGEPYDIEHRIVVGESVKWVRERATLEFDADGNLLGGFGTAQDITEQKHAELAIRRIAQFPEENPNPVMRISDDGALLYANTPARKWLESADIREEHRAADALSPLLSAASQTAHVVRRELSTPGGQTMLFSAVRPEGESYINIYGLNITDRKMYETALLDSKERLRLALDAAQMGTWDWDVTGGEVIWSDEIYRMLGYAVDEIKPSHLAWITRVHPDDLEATESALRLAMDRQGDYHAEFRVVRPDGTERWIEALGRFEQNTAGEAVRNYGVMLDISERKAAEDMIRRSRDELELKVAERTAALTEINRELEMEVRERRVVEEKLISSLETVHDLYENAPCGYHSLDNDGAIIRINDTELRWLGYERDEVLGRMNFSSLITSDCQDVFRKNFPVLKKTGQVRDLEFDMVRKDGSIMPVLLNATAVKDPDGNFVMTRSTVFDITERRKAEKEALRAAHLASIGELAAGVAHEINNPVNSIINYAQILVNKGDRTRKEYEFAGEIVKEGERIATIVSSLLSFSRKTDEKRTPTSVRELLKSSLALTSAQLQKDGIHLNLSIPDLLPDLMVVPQQILQVFLNMISNARYALNQKYPEPDAGKALEIRCETVPNDERPMLRITFLDTGTGIPSSLMDKVTEPFFTTKPGQQGTGLGLSICNNIVIRHGGSLSISSAEGQYTEVSVLLPTAWKDEAR